MKPQSSILSLFRRVWQWLVYLPVVEEDHAAQFRLQTVGILSLIQVITTPGAYIFVPSIHQIIVTIGYFVLFVAIRIPRFTRYARLLYGIQLTFHLIVITTFGNTASVVDPIQLLLQFSAVWSFPTVIYFIISPRQFLLGATALSIALFVYSMFAMGLFQLVPAPLLTAALYFTPAGVLGIWGYSFYNNHLEKLRLQQLLQALKQAQQSARDAQEANRLKSEFLATMSHELRTPLHAIIGYADVQLAGVAGDLSHETKGYQERIMVNAEHLLAIINDVLDISKIEAGRIDISKESFQMAELIEQVLAETRGLAVQKGLDYSFELDPNLLGRITGDSARIRQIVINLIGNAIKFCENGSVRAFARRDGDFWMLSVQDTGLGIPREAQEYIFDEFRQVDGSHSRKYGGTGLGLAIVKKLVLMMNGTIDLQSEVGVGSTFTIRLPLAPEDRMTLHTETLQKEWNHAVVG
jgi:signal transduction histidine kinase